MEIEDTPCFALLSVTGLVARTADDTPPARDGRRSPHDVLRSVVPATARADVGVVTSSGRILRLSLLVMMAALTPMGAFAGWVAERWHARRGFRRASAAYRDAVADTQTTIDRELAKETEHRRASDPDPVTLSHIAAAGGARLWARDRASPDLLRVRIGLGREDSRLDVDRSGHISPAGVVEEAAEVWMAAEHESAERTAEEISQLLYRVQVIMLGKGIGLEDVYRHL